MNERINELAIKAGGIWQGGYVEQANGDSVYTDKKFVSGGDMDVEQFARLIVAECNKISKETCNELKADESIQTPGSKINWNLYNATLRNKLAEHFWVEL
jgi:hypothetical protein